MDKEAIKYSFQKAKNDIESLKEQFSTIMQEVQEIKRTLEYIHSMDKVKQIYQSDTPTDKPTHETINTTETPQMTGDPTDNLPYKRLKPHIYTLSTGNGGVPTDKQTNQQTDTFSHIPSRIDQIERVSEILESLDSIKKDLRSRFKHLTKQEMLVFSTLYQLQEEKETNRDDDFIVDYSSIAAKLSLSESSIREYIQKIIKKGIPIQKTKENNKKIILNIPEEFKKIASLSTIIQLREL